MTWRRDARDQSRDNQGRIGLGTYHLVVQGLVEDTGKTRPKRIDTALERSGHTVLRGRRVRRIIRIIGNRHAISADDGIVSLGVSGSGDVRHSIWFSSKLAQHTP